MKHLKYIFISALIAVSFALSALTVSAADAYLSISSAECSVGDSVSVNLTVSGEKVGGYTVTVTYSTGLLEFVSATSATTGATVTSNDSGGVLKIVHMYNDTNEGTLTATLNFKATNSGTAQLSAQFIGVGPVVDKTGDELDAAISGGGTVTVYPARTASSDSRLVSLAISPGSLDPAFDPELPYYSTTVPASCSNLAVSAVKNEEHASVRVIGSSGLQYGTNVVVVRVTAENGEVREYEITVNRLPESLETEEPDPDDQPAMPFVTYINKDGEKEAYEVTPIEDAETLPAGFKLSKTTIDEKEAPCGFNPDIGMYIVYVKDEMRDIDGFYVLHPGAEVTPLDFISTESKYIILDATDVIPPENYVLDDYEIDGKTHKVFFLKYDKNPDHVLVYALNSEGKNGIYVYDLKEKTMQKYGILDGGDYAIETTVPESGRTSPETSTPDTEPSRESKGGSALGTILKIGIPAALVITIVVLIITSRGGKNRGNEDYSGEDYEGDGDEFDEDEFDESVYDDGENERRYSEDPLPEELTEDKEFDVPEDEAAENADDGKEIDMDEYLRQIRENNGDNDTDQGV